MIIVSILAKGASFFIQMFNNYLEELPIASETEGVISKEPNILMPETTANKDITGDRNITGGSNIGLPNSSYDPKVYDTVYKALMSAKDSVYITPGLASDDLYKMIEDIVNDEPLILFLEGYTYRSDGHLIFHYHKDAEFIKQAQKEIKDLADRIISSIIKPGMTDFEKELAIHDYIVTNTSYDTENYNSGTIPPESYNAYGVLINKKAVCEGYARTMKLLLDMAGIDSMIVSGKSKAQNHAWNLVNIGGYWYHVDATWNDPVLKDGEEILQHTYFNLTDKDMSIDHEWDKGVYPPCISYKYNYYNYKRLLVSSKEEFENLLIDLIQEGRTFITIKIDNYASHSYNVEELISFAVNYTKSGVSYNIIEEHGIINIWIGDLI